MDREILGSAAGRQLPCSLRLMPYSLLINMRVAKNCWWFDGFFPLEDLSSYWILLRFLLYPLRLRLVLNTVTRTLNQTKVSVNRVLTSSKMLSWWPSISILVTQSDSSFPPLASSTWHYSRRFGLRPPITWPVISLTIRQGYVQPHSSLGKKLCYAYC